MSATQIVPTPTRQMLVDTIELAEKLTGHAAVTRDADLIAAAVIAQKAAWAALQRFDQHTA